MGYVYLAPVVGFGLTAIRAGQDLFRKFRLEEVDDLNLEVTN